jgi:hypothetical protein
VVVVIGPEVPKTGEPTATATLPVPTQSAVIAPTTPAETLGAIGVTSRLCEPGVTVEKISERTCPVVGQGFDLSLNSDALSRTLGDAAQIDQTWYWNDLPLGQYAFAATAYPTNANDYFVPGSAAVGGSSATGYNVTLDPSAPNLILTVYFLQPSAPPTTALTTFAFQACTAGPSGPTDCNTPASYNIDPQPYLVSEDGLTTLSVSDAQVAGDSYTWNLPPGTWYLYQKGWPYDFQVDGQRYAGGAPYVFASDGATQTGHNVQDLYVPIQ